MATRDQINNANAQGRADAANGIYNNPSDPIGMGILKSNDRQIYEAYREGHGDKTREIKQSK